MLDRLIEHHGALLLEGAEQVADIGCWALTLPELAWSWSDGMHRIHGVEPGPLARGPAALMRCVTPDDQERVKGLLAWVLAHPDQIPPEGITLDYRVAWSDGSLRAVRVHGRLHRTSGDERVRLVGVAQDVTEGDLRERDLHAHTAVSTALAEWRSFETGAPALLGRLGAALHTPLALLWTRSAGRGRLAVRAGWSARGTDAEVFAAKSRELRRRHGQAVPVQAWATGRPVVVDDLEAHLPRGRRGPAARLRLRSGIAVPALTDREPLAVLTFYSRDRRVANDRLMRTLTNVGRDVGRFLSRRRGELGEAPLSPRELEVIRLAADGHSGPQIAALLFVSPATIKTHFENIYAKLGVSDRAAAVATALRQGLIA